MTNTRYLLMIALAGAAVVGLGLASLALGSAGIPPRQVFTLLWSWLRGDTGRGTAALIVLQLRLPRIILGGLVGAGLATAGTAFQAILRNPLADPYVIGVSAGAGLGATLGIILGPEHRHPRIQHRPGPGVPRRHTHGGRGLCTGADG